MNEYSDHEREYLTHDMQRWQKHWGFKKLLSFPSFFPVRTVLPLRVNLIEPATTNVLFKAVWLDQRNIGEESELLQVLNENNFPGDTLIAQAKNDNAIKSILRENGERAKKNGVVGVPSFQVDDGDCVWGQDKLDIVESLLSGELKQGRGPSKL